MRFTLAAICAGAAWWGIGMATLPDVFVRRSPSSLVVALITVLLTAHLLRPIYRRSVVHLLWLTPVSVYFAAAVLGYLLPLATERVDVLERCLEMMRALCVGVTFTTFRYLVFPTALATHWLLRRMERWPARPAATGSET